VAFFCRMEGVSSPPASAKPPDCSGPTFANTGERKDGAIHYETFATKSEVFSWANPVTKCTSLHFARTGDKKEVTIHSESF
jgi:hypothetical protein